MEFCLGLSFGPTGDPEELRCSTSGWRELETHEAAWDSRWKRNGRMGGMGGLARAAILLIYDARIRTSLVSGRVLLSEMW